MFKYKYLVNAVIVVASLMVQGCAVKSRPYSLAEYEDRARLSLAHVSGNYAPIHAPIGLYQAMARALKYNLNYRVKSAETSLSMAETRLAHFSLLPNAILKSNYTRRNNHLASSSFNLVTNEPNFSESTSQDLEQSSSDLTFSWNILDFGLSYVRAKQSSDKVLISKELQRKIAQNLLEEVRGVFWRAVSYQRLSGKMKALEKRILRARNNARALSRSRQTSKITALTNERELVKISRNIKQLQRNTAIAKAELAVLINIPPGTPYTLIDGDKSNLPKRLNLSVEQMINRAIRDRFELRENWYQQRINKREARAALIEMLPGIQVFAGPSFSSNSFLLNANWVSWGAKASWNLLRVFQYPAKSRVIKQQDKVLQARALAITITIMAQVHISRISYYQQKQELSAARDYLSVQKRLLRQLKNEAAANLVSENKLLREELGTLVAEAKYDVAHAAAQAAYANLFATIGIDPFNEFDTDMPLDDLAYSLKAGWAGMDSIKTNHLSIASKPGPQYTKPKREVSSDPIITSSTRKTARKVGKQRDSRIVLRRLFSKKHRINKVQNRQSTRVKHTMASDAIITSGIEKPKRRARTRRDTTPILRRLLSKRHRKNKIRYRKSAPVKIDANLDIVSIASTITRQQRTEKRHDTRPILRRWFAK